MKVNDIIHEGINLDKPVPISNRRHFKLFLRGKGHKAIGQGADATVYHTGQGVVTRTAAISTLDDPYLTFLKKVAIPNQNNPFFARIYNAKLYENADWKPSDDYDDYYNDAESRRGIYNDPDEGKKYGLVVQMEKLVPMQHEKLKDVLPHVFRQMGVTEQLFKDTMAAVPDDIKKYPKGQVSSQMITLFAKAIVNEDILRMLASKAENPQFVKAVKALQIGVKFGLDLHHNNAMFRLTPHGPQLVIIDPYNPASEYNDES